MDMAVKWKVLKELYHDIIRPALEAAAKQSNSNVDWEIIRLIDQLFNQPPE